MIIADPPAPTPIPTSTAIYMAPPMSIMEVPKEPVNGRGGLKTGVGGK